MSCWFGSDQSIENYIAFRFNGVERKEVDEILCTGVYTLLDDILHTDGTTDMEPQEVIDYWCNNDLFH